MYNLEDLGWTSKDVEVYTKDVGGYQDMYGHTGIYIYIYTY